MGPSTIWLIVLVVLIAGEAATVGLTFIWFAIGALGALITAWLGGAIWLQAVVFLALSALALVLVRPLATQFLKTSRTPTNADRVIGRTALVTETIECGRQGPGEYLRTGLVGQKSERRGDSGGHRGKGAAD